MKKIGLFFGSFNPIHVGHLIIANAMIHQTELDKVWFVVSPQNPFKKRSNLLHEFDRIDMVRAAVYEDDNLEASDIEFSLPKPSFTVDTLTYLVDKHPTYEFSLIIGEDNLDHFHKWKNYQEILKHHDIYVYPRPNAKGNELINHDRIHQVKAPLLDISATYIRNLIKENRSIKYLLPAKVEELILARGYYS